MDVFSPSLTNEFVNGGAEQNLNFNGASPLTTNASTFGVAANTTGYRGIYLTMRFELRPFADP